MTRIRMTVLLVALSALGLAFAACGGGGGAEPTPTGTPAATATTAPQATATEMPVPTATQPPAPTATTPPQPTAPGSAATEVDVVAQNLSFSPSVIQAPANAPFTIVLDNRDNSVSHNIAIFADQAQADAGNALFATAIAPGPITQTLSVPSLAPGDYFVWCQVHRSLMTATLRVQ